MAGYVNSNDALRRFFAQRGDRVWARGSSFSIYKELGSGTTLSIDVDWSAEHSIVMFLVALPIRVTESRRAALAQRVQEINLQLAVTGFELQGQAIFFRTHAFLDHTGSLCSEIAARTVDACMGAIAKHVDDLQRVAGPEGVP